MRMKSLYSPRLVLLAVAVLTVVLVPGFASGGGATVMTQNLYLGTDLAPVLGATTIPGLIVAATAGFAQVNATNFAERAVALAKEVETAKPTLIALQEVSLFRTRSASAPPPATTVVFDYLQLLLDALAARGLQYGVVAEVKNFDSEIPIFLPYPNIGYVRLTDRDVILARTDLKLDLLSLSNVQSSNFAANLTVTAAGVPLTLLRGWASVDVTVKGKTFRFLTTHLEPFYPPIQVAQANELLAGPGNTNLPLVFAGDFNTNAEALPGTDTPTYGNLIAAGFVDAWSQIDPLDPGYTCCEAANLLNVNPSLDTRIDLVLLRDGFGMRKGSIAADAAEVVGEEPEDKTPSGLWPSDHAGVVVKFHLGGPGEDPE